MIYIDEIDDYTIRFGNDVGGGDYFKSVRKPIHAYKDELNRINIWDVATQTQIIHHEDHTNIALDGTVHASAEAFVVAFNQIGALLNYLFDSEGVALYDINGVRLTHL